MRVALLFSGQVRSISPELFNYGLKEFVSGLDVDVYLSCWAEAGISGNHKEDILLSDKRVQLNLDQYFATAFDGIPVKGKAIVDEHSFRAGSFQKNTQTIDLRCDDVRTINSLPQLFHIKNCFDLVEKTNITYDYYVRVRFDSVFVAPLRIALRDCNRSSIFNINFGRAYYPSRVYDIFFIVPSSYKEIFSLSYDEFHRFSLDETNNGLAKNDACRILWCACNALGIGVQSISFRLCDVYRNDNKYFLDLIKWIPLKGFSIAFFISYYRVWKFAKSLK